MNRNELTYHTPALLRETIEGLNIRPSGIYIDATFGGGGHSRGILERLGNDGRLFGFDQDADAEQNIVNDSRFSFVRGNFRYLSNFMRYLGVDRVDGIMADLGVSSHHFDDTTRGFSFRTNGVLDMRMNNRAGQTAADILNTYAEKQLADVFYRYGELRESRQIAAAIVRRRRTNLFATIPDLMDILTTFCGREKEKQFFAKAFQALRIEVNMEMQALCELLEQSLLLLNDGGRLAIITYHSLEDRMTKHFMKTGHTDGSIVKDIYGNVSAPFRLVSKAITPSNEEVISNSRSRSARLRVAERIQNTNI